MEWYQIVFGVLCWFVGIWLMAKFNDFRKHYHQNETFKADLKKWRNKKRRNN